MNIRNDNFLVVSTHLKNMSQIGSFPQVGVKIKNIRNHLDKMCVHPPEAFLNFTPKKGILHSFGWREVAGPQAGLPKESTKATWENRLKHHGGTKALG